MGVFFGVAKISIFGGVLEIPDFFFFFGGGGNGWCLARAYVRRKNEITTPPPPPHFNTPMMNWCNAQLQLHKIV